MSTTCISASRSTRSSTTTPPDLAAALAKAEADLDTVPQNLADLTADLDALLALQNNADAMADFTDAEKVDLGVVIGRLQDAIKVLQNEATTEAAKQKIVSDIGRDLEGFRRRYDH